MGHWNSHWNGLDDVVVSLDRDWNGMGIRSGDWDFNGDLLHVDLSRQLDSDLGSDFGNGADRSQHLLSLDQFRPGRGVSGWNGGP